MRYKNRKQAGQLLADKLESEDLKRATVLAIPRGGIVPAYEIAKKFNLPLDIVVTKKIGAPNNPEFAIGSVNMEGQVFINPDARSLGAVTQNYINKQSQIIHQKIKDKLKRLRGSSRPLELAGKKIIVVDDGIATGMTVKAALEFLKSKKPKKIILAVPVAPPDSLESLKPLANKVICLQTPKFFGAVGAYYEEFPQVQDEQVKKILKNYN